jgi:hypothetical protein
MTRQPTKKTKRKRRPLAVTQVRKGTTRVRGPQLLGKHYITIGLDGDINERVNEIAGSTHENAAVIIRHALRSGLGMPTIADIPIQTVAIDGEHPKGYFAEDTL